MKGQRGSQDVHKRHPGEAGDIYSCSQSAKEGTSAHLGIKDGEEMQSHPSVVLP